MRFAQSVVHSNHDLYRVFFYKQAVSIASKHAIAPQDEMQLTEMWIDLARKSKAELIVCVAAGQRRGLVQTILADEFEIAGLGQMVEAILESDRIDRLYADNQSLYERNLQFASCHLSFQTIDVSEITQLFNEHNIVVTD